MRLPDPRAAEMRRRIARVQAEIRRRRLDAFLVYDRFNTFYLSGFRCTLSFLWITRNEALFWVDGRYIEGARTTVRHCDVRLMPHARRAFELMEKQWHPRRIGFEATTTFGALRQWREWIAGAEWEECGEIIARMRLIKSSAEVRAIETSARLNDRVFARALEAVRSGATEIDIRNAIRRGVDELQAEGQAFECIVAAGAMAARPHYTPQARALEAGELLLIDQGVLQDGYCSDMTRIVGIGRKPKPRLMKIYNAVLEAEEAALAEVGPGVRCAELDRIARDKLKARRLAQYFTHGLGHGVGLEIHEPPTLNSRSVETLRSGMIVTIEPGVYLPGVGGVRIEDLVAVTRNGHKVLSRTPKEWRVLPWSA